LGLKVREFDKMVGFAQAPSEAVSAAKAGSATAAQKIPGSSSVVEANPFHLPLFRDLREKGAIDVLAHPTVQTVTRRMTSISVGGHIPIRVKSPAGEFSLRRIPIGTQVEVVPVVLPNHRIRLQACVELTKISGDGVVGDDGTIQPQVSSRRLNTEIEMQLGQTLAVGRWVFDRPADAAARDDQSSPQGTIRPIAHAYAPSESVETVVFITPRLVHQAGSPQPLPAEPAARAGETEDAQLPEDLNPTDGDAFGPVVPVLKRRTTGRD
jgi:Flp pilus assembly secretin CpaC